MGEYGLPFYRLSFDRRPLEFVNSLGKAGKEFFDGDIGKRRLRALEEQLGQALFSQAAVGDDVQDRPPVGVFDFERPPGFSVERDLNTNIVRRYRPPRSCTR